MCECVVGWGGVGWGEVGDGVVFFFWGGGGSKVCNMT